MYLLQSIAFLTSVVYGFSSSTTTSPDNYHHYLFPHQNPTTTNSCPSRTTTTTTRIQQQKQQYSFKHSNTMMTMMMRATHQQQQQQSSNSDRSSSFSSSRFVVPSNRNPYKTRSIGTVLAFHRGGGTGTVGSAKTTTTTTKNSDATTPTSLQLSSTFNTGTKCPMTGTATILASLWGTGGVLYILLKAVKRVLPIALEPFQTASNGLVPLTSWQLSAYVFTCLWFAYVEGYKGFQTKFSPLVVKRSFTLVPGKNGTSWYHYFLAPFYCMGLIHATKKRQIISWSVTTGVALIVAGVKMLPYPYRNIVDAGVVTGLTWGSISIAILYLKSWFTGKPPSNVDAALPISVKAL